MQTKAMMRRVQIALACLVVVMIHAPVWAGPWDMEPPMPTGDPQWDKVRTLWAGHYGGRNLDELIAALTPLKEAQPGRIEPLLCLARVHYLHARYESKDRAKHFELSESYIKQALSIDPKNLLAVKMLADTMCYSRDREYIFKNYGAIFKSFAPLPIGEALPDMKDNPNWPAFKKTWEARTDIEKAKAALAMLEKMVQEKPTGLSCAWASRAACYIGESYSSAGEHETKAVPYYEKGSQYGERAIKIAPGSVPAHYWYQLNLARSIQTKNLITKARYLMPLLENLLFCSRENSIYFFVSPALVLSGMIVEGGWVCERGMRLAGITTAMDANGMEMAEIVYPDYFAITYSRANLLAYQGKRTEALAILEKLLARNPDTVKVIAPENRNNLKDARRLYVRLKENK